LKTRAIIETSEKQARGRVGLKAQEPPSELLGIFGERRLLAPLHELLKQHFGLRVRDDGLGLGGSQDRLQLAKARLGVFTA
jgi:hypothetical protein